MTPDHQNSSPNFCNSIIFSLTNSAPEKNHVRNRPQHYHQCSKGHDKPSSNKE
jgi:hypothetical protein